MNSKIKTFRPGLELPKHYFFILSKGQNAGKPLKSPCANCYVFIAENSTECEFYYWLCYALWQGKRFEIYLVGSVIPFIRINDVKSLVFEASQKAYQNLTEYQNSLSLLIHIDNQAQTMNQQLKLLKQAKQAIVYKVLK